MAYDTLNRLLKEAVQETDYPKGMSEAIDAIKDASSELVRWHTPDTDTAPGMFLLTGSVGHIGQAGAEISADDDVVRFSYMVKALPHSRTNS
jgi:hypothetical protein